MRIAAIYDIHGNLPALESVLHEIRRAEISHLIVGGDVVPGPMPNEALDLLLQFEMPVRFLMGNTDREVLARMSGIETDWYRRAPEQWREPVRWSAEQLTDAHGKLITTWPLTCRVDTQEYGTVMFCHATPQDDNQNITRLTPNDVLASAFGTNDASIIVCGHTHMQFDRTIEEVRIVNAGSVGMPFGMPGANWLLLDSEVRLQHTEYDLVAAAKRIRATDYPQAADFADGFVLNPPSEVEMLKQFHPAELK